MREFEGVPADFDHVEVLGWAINSLESAVHSFFREKDRFERTLRRQDRVEIALLWASGGSMNAPTNWGLVQAFRRRDSGEVWRRSLFNRELSAPLPRLRPGETADGTWHAYQRYDHAPTAREICEFADVDFLLKLHVPGTQPLRRELRDRAWLRVAGQKPPCGFHSH